MLDFVKSQLDALPAAAFLWDCADGSIVHANAAAAAAGMAGAGLTLNPTRPVRTLFEEKTVRPIAEASVVLQSGDGMFVPMEGWVYCPYDRPEDLDAGASMLIFVSSPEGLAPDIKRAVRAIGLSQTPAGYADPSGGGGDGVSRASGELTTDKMRFLALSELMTYNSFILILWETVTLNVNYVSSNMGLLGIKPAKLAHMNDWAAMVHPDDIDEFWTRRRGLLECDTNVDFWQEYRVVNAAGEVRWVNERVSFFSSAGAHIYRSMMIDATARHENENISSYAASGIHDGEPLSPGNIHILDIVSREYLQQLCDTVSDILGISSYIIDPSGAGLTEPSGTCELCRMIRESERGAKLCKLSDVNLSIEARDAGGLVAAPCETIGLYNAASPVVVGGRHLATWMIGRVRAGNTVGDDNIAALSRQLQMDESAALESFRSMPEHEAGDILQVFSLLNPYVRDLSEFIDHSFLMMQETEKLVRSQEFLAKSADMDALQGRMYESFYDMRQSGDMSRFQDAFAGICDFFGFSRASVIRLHSGRAEHIYKWDSVPEMEHDLPDEFSVLTKLCENSSEAVTVERSRLPESWGAVLDSVGADIFYVYSIETHGRPVGVISFAMSAVRPLLNDEEKSFLTQLMRTAGSYVIMKQIERRMYETSESLYSILDNLQDNIYVVDRNTYEVIFANRNFNGQCITGPCGMTCFMMLGLNGPCACCGLDMLKGMPDGHSYTFETSERTPGYWHSVTMTAMTWLGERPVYLVNMRDITENKLRHEQYLNAATFDMTLGIPNFGRLDSKLNALLNARNTRGYIFVIHVDNVKLINNAYGHDHGDALLREITAFLRSSVNEDFLYRYNSESVAVLYEGCDKAQADRFLQALYERFNLSWRIMDKRCFSTFSAVMTDYRSGGPDVKKLMRDIDIALERYVDHGFNNVHELTHSLETNSAEIIELANDLHQMVGDGCGDILVYYQPVYDLVNKRITHFEALMRWKHPTRGIIPPLKFISIAEQTSLISMLSERLISIAVEQCLVWRKKLPWLKISVNLSAAHARKSGVVKDISDILEAGGLSFSDLIIEVNENAAGSDRYLREFMRGMRKLGFQVALDNFGAGMSSLNGIQNMPADIINIDRCFISNITESDYDKSFVGFMVRAGETLGMRTVCHGVETAEQFRELRAAGVDFMQGYLLSRPLPADEIDRILTRRLEDIPGCFD